MIDSADAQALPILHNLPRGISGMGTEKARNLTAPYSYSYPGNENRALRKERGNKVLSAGYFSGLVTQSEMDDLLDMLYGSYGEYLIVTHKQAS
jgi:hypothetical protein